MSTKERLSIRQLADREGVHPDTVRRWIKCGVQIAGKVIILEARRVGRNLRIEPAAWDAFDAACNGGPGSAELARKKSSDTDRKRIAAANRRLRELGV